MKNRSYTRNRTDKKTAKFMWLLCSSFLIPALIVTAVLAKYQLKSHVEYEAAVLNQQTIESDVTAKRGIITDRNGEILATNITVYDVILSPFDIDSLENKNLALLRDDDPENNPVYSYEDEETGMKWESTSVEKIITDVLSYYLDIDSSKLYELAERKSERGEYYKYSLVRSKVSEDLYNKLKNFADKCSISAELYFAETYKRYYPYGTLAAHAIGFTNSAGRGVYGIEAYYDDILSGTNGKYVLTRDAKKNTPPSSYSRIVTEQNGCNIRTTLDVTIQYALEKQLKKTFEESGAAERVCGIVLDTETAEVLAMAVYPDYNPNTPSVLCDYYQNILDEMSKNRSYKDLTDDHSSYNRLMMKDLGLDDIYPKDGTEEYNAAYNALLLKMWNNKCVSETYEPGSTFKIITTSMALEEGVINQYTEFYCPGYWTVEGWDKPIACAQASGHGLVSFRYGLQQSCNPTLMQVAALIGRQTFYKYYQTYGYTEKTGIDLPGEAATVYTPYSDFSNVSLAVYSFGQTFRTTPIQQIRAVNTVACGGTLMTPHLLLEVKDSDGNVLSSYGNAAVRQIVSRDTCDLITDILEEGVATDGAAANAYCKGFRVAAKTGTSEKLDVYDEKGETTYRVGSTVAFAPADDPKITALIMVDTPLDKGPYGGTVAAPYISSLLSEVLPYLGVVPQYTTDELANLDISIGSFVSLSVEDSLNELKWAGFTYEIIGNGDTITAQTPPAGSKISSDTGFLILYTGDEVPVNTVTVPDFSGMNGFNADAAARAAELNVTFSGSADATASSVINQYPAAGTKVPRGTIVSIELQRLDVND